MTRLLHAELRRLFARRMVRVTVGLIAVAIVVGGVLVFTTGGEFTARALQHEGHGLLPWQMDELLADFERAGFGYWDYPATPNYGIARAKPEWVYRLLERIPLQVVWHEPAGWAQRQDVYACIPAESR